MRRFRSCVVRLFICVAPVGNDVTIGKSKSPKRLGGKSLGSLPSAHVHAKREYEAAIETTCKQQENTTHQDNPRNETNISKKVGPLRKSRRSNLKLSTINIYCPLLAPFSHPQYKTYKSTYQTKAQYLAP
jgi:hypothetical protein